MKIRTARKITNACNFNAENFGKLYDFNSPFQLDRQLQSGDYFLDEKAKKAKKQKERDEKHAEAEKKREERRNKDFIPPEENDASTSKEKTKSTLDIVELKNKILKARKGTKVFKT